MFRTPFGVENAYSNKIVHSFNLFSSSKSDSFYKFNKFLVFLNSQFVTRIDYLYKNNCNWEFRPKTERFVNLKMFCNNLAGSKPIFFYGLSFYLNFIISVNIFVLQCTFKFNIFGSQMNSNKKKNLKKKVFWWGKLCNKLTFIFNSNQNEQISFLFFFLHKKKEIIWSKESQHPCAVIYIFWIRYEKKVNRLHLEG